MLNPQKKVAEYSEFFNECLEAQREGRAFDKDLVLKKFKELLKQNKYCGGKPEIYDALGMAASLLGNKEDAVKYHKAAVTINPTALRYHNYSVSLSLFEDYEKALVYSEKAIQEEPTVLFYQIGYIENLKDLGMISKAIAYIEHLLDHEFLGNEELKVKMDHTVARQRLEAIKQRAGKKGILKDTGIPKGFEADEKKFLRQTERIFIENRPQ